MGDGVRARCIGQIEGWRGRYWRKKEIVWRTESFTTLYIIIFIVAVCFSNNGASEA
jgi:hypothetical protein